MEVGKEDSSSNHGRTSKEDGSDDDDGNSPSGQKVGDDDDSLLVSVGEVVISRRHEALHSGGVLLVQSSVKVGGSSVELLAVLYVLLIVGVGIAVDLVQSGERVSQRGRIEEGRVSSVDELSVLEGGRGVVFDLDDVGSIGLVLSFSGISCGVVVASHPLEVDVISLSHFQVVGDEIVLDRGISLYDISSLSSDVKVEDSGGVGDSRRSSNDSERMRSVLEGSSVLGSVQSQGQVDVFDRDGGVVGQNSREFLGIISIFGRIGEFLSESNDVSGRNVVSDSENA
jgi:hypothetical protein